MKTPLSVFGFAGRFFLTGIGPLLAALVVMTLPSRAHAQITRVAATTLTLPQNPQTFGYSTEPAFAGITFDQPVAIVTPPGEVDRVFVVEKTGRIQVVTALSTTPVKQVFLDLSARTLTSSEQGTLGLAFHPNFATNHYFYVFYSTTATTSAGTGAHQRVARFTALTGSPTNAQLIATEFPLISQRDDADNHNGGDLHFGPDGYLYVSLGDEGGANDQFNNSQRIDKDFFAGILRLDVDQLSGNLTPNAHPSVHTGSYKIPVDNPFVGASTFNGLAVTPANVRSEFWAVGLRNPWRFSFDFPTARLIVGDVGQGAREEIDLVTRGGNYGWSYREGTIAGPRANPPAGATFLDPIWEAGRSAASSITGGVVYRGTRFAQLFGRYVFGDYGANRLFLMTFPASGPVQVETSITVSSPVGFGADPRNGDVLIASIGTGQLLRLIYSATGTGTPLPATLTATGAFSSLANLTPAAGVVAYDPNVSFWSDFAKKRRWFSVPALADKITFAADGNWTYPAGTVWVKHFDLELTRGDPATARRLETRFIVKTASGLYGVTYKWNLAQTEATLVAEAGETESIAINDAGTTRTQTWRYPSRAECLQCHTAVGGHALSFNTAQLNRSQAYASGAANQLTALANAGYFSATIPNSSTLRALAPASDTAATLEHRVRSYLAANCVQCHQPGGAALGNWDARIQTPTASTGLLNGALVDSRGDAANRVIVPADSTHSMMLTRISTRGPGQMPPLASSELDTANIALVTAWISALGPPQFTTQPLSQTALVGSSVTFTVVGSGTPAPSYQWKKNGTLISGESNATLTLVNVSLAAAGTYTAIATNSVGSTTSNGAVLTVQNAFSAADFNGDGKADLLWQNTATGARRVWLMNGTTKSGEVALSQAGTDWQIAGNADFNTDGRPDILWQNTITGERRADLMNGTTVVSAIAFSVVDPAWNIGGAADLNGDGQPDIIWENTLTGERGAWLMLGTVRIGWAALGRLAVQWNLVGTGDFNGDRKPDLVWQNALTGERRIWLMNGAVKASEVSLGFVALEWAIGSIADYTGDGQPDIFWQNSSTGERLIWVMNGTSLGSYAFLPTETVDWVIGRIARRPAVADFNRDGKPDLIWQNSATGERKVWLMNATTFNSEVSLGIVGVDWQVAGAGDLDGDGICDVLWQNGSTGERGIWVMSGTNVAGFVSLGTVPTPWQMTGSGDFNADNHRDIVWQNTVTGERGIWLMAGTALSGYASLGVVAPVWQIAAVADLNRDDAPDLIWQNTGTGERKVWLMNGVAFSSEVSLGTVGLDWQIVGAADYDLNGSVDLVWQNTLTGERGIWLMNATVLSGYVSLGIQPPLWQIAN